MKPRVIGAFIIIALALVACMSERESAQVNKGIAEAFIAPINALAVQLTGGTEIAYATAAFQRRNSRWPTNYAELTNFVAKSDGYLIMRDYGAIDFSNTPDGRLRVTFIQPGKTNQHTFILSTNKPPTPDLNTIPLTPLNPVRDQ